MAFISYVEKDQIPDSLQVPDDDNILQIHGAHPEVMKQHYELYLQLMHRKGPLPRLEREMVAVYVSSINHCHY